MQPDWRSQGSVWPPPRDIPAVGHNWGKLAHSGPSGFFLVIMALGWWGKLVESHSGDLAEFEVAMDDVLWVVCNIIDSLSKAPAKRVRFEDEDTSGKPNSKR